MKSSTKNEIKGKAGEVAGKVKKAVGAHTGDADLHNEGQADQVGGKVQKKVGQVQKVFGK
jgi:uncharacterized protein YjbJ (UPF0337 family)